ncbi:MAG: hypothetical protein EOP04_18960 [Proteobacteria bacterium]|nr:MAG: hypothetical protein EOP04_18960 [Pseudomonadota bacterium]
MLRNTRLTRYALLLLAVVWVLVAAKLIHDLTERGHRFITILEPRTGVFASAWVSPVDARTARITVAVTSKVWIFPVDEVITMFEVDTAYCDTCLRLDWRSSKTLEVLHGAEMRRRLEVFDTFVAGNPVHVLYTAVEEDP